MALPETKVTKTANTMDSTVISFSLDLTIVEWVENDNFKEININN